MIDTDFSGTGQSSIGKRPKIESIERRLLAVSLKRLGSRFWQSTIHLSALDNQLSRNPSLPEGKRRGPVFQDRPCRECPRLSDLRVNRLVITGTVQYQLILQT